MAVRVAGYEGVAFWFDRTCDKHVHCGLYVMVGDDLRHHVDMHDVTPIDDPDEYCAECGQVGCDWA